MNAMNEQQKSGVEPLRVLALKQLFLNQKIPNSYEKSLMRTNVVREHFSELDEQMQVEHFGLLDLRAQKWFKEQKMKEIVRDNSRISIKGKVAQRVAALDILERIEQRESATRVARRSSERGLV
jgi:hypothetical protein